MTDETPPVRDSSGRFIRNAAETVNTMSRTTGEGIHPMSKVFFGWVSHKHTGRILFWLFAALSLGLVLLDLVVPRHEKIALAGSVGFYGLWGFAAFSFAVLSGWPLGHMLRRSEDYYGDPGGPPPDVDPNRPGAEEGDA
jgi:hypothetical protein